MLNSAIQLSLEDACVEQSWLSSRRLPRGVGSGVLAMILHHVPLYLHFSSVRVVWEVGHMITINRCEEAASDIF